MTHSSTKRGWYSFILRDFVFWMSSKPGLYLYHLHLIITIPYCIPTWEELFGFASERRTLILKVVHKWFKSYNFISFLLAFLLLHCFPPTSTHNLLIICMLTLNFHTILCLPGKFVIMCFWKRCWHLEVEVWFFR